MLYIDAFNHILPKKYQAVLEQKVPNRDMSSNLSRYAETVPTLLDLDARFRLMDSVEGYMQVLTLAAPTVESVASPEVAVDLCRFANDEMAELVEKYPDRFAAAIAALPLNDLDASLKEIDRAIRDLRLRGIQMYSDVNGMPLDAEALYPIYEKMERYNLPILIHPKRSPALPDYPGEENSRYRAWTKLGWPVASSMAMFRLVYGGVMERFPNLKIVTHHCGGGADTAGLLHLLQAVSSKADLYAVQLLLQLAHTGGQLAAVAYLAGALAEIPAVGHRIILAVDDLDLHCEAGALLLEQLDSLNGVVIGAGAAGVDAQVNQIGVALIDIAGINITELQLGDGRGGRHALRIAHHLVELVVRKVLALHVLNTVKVDGKAHDLDAVLVRKLLRNIGTGIRQKTDLAHFTSSLHS